MWPFLEGQQSGYSFEGFPQSVWGALSSQALQRMPIVISTNCLRASSGRSGTPAPDLVRTVEDDVAPAGEQAEDWSFYLLSPGRAL